MGPIMANERQEDNEAGEIDSWEEIDETDVLEKKINQLKMPSIGDNSENSHPQEPIKVILTGDDAYRSQYVPPEPTVKILKRPTKDTQSSDSKKTLPKKTLQQREQEYAEARLRILGEPLMAGNSIDERISIVKIKSGDTEFTRPPEPETKPTLSQSENIIRLPKGPDGTSGFNLLR